MSAPNDDLPVDGKLLLAWGIADAQIGDVVTALRREGVDKVGDLKVFALSSVWASCSLPGAVKARLELPFRSPSVLPPTPVAAATDSMLNPLVEHFRKEAQREAEPWRRKSEAVALQHDAFKRMANADLRRDAIALAKSNHWSAADVLYVLAADIFAEASDREFYGALFVRTADEAERRRHHNWWQAKKYDEAFLAAHAAKLDTLPWPLFPASEKEWLAVNLSLLADVSIAAGGETRVARRRPPIFRSLEVKSTDGTSGGDPWLLVRGPNDRGEFAVDAGPISQEVETLRKKCETQRRELAVLHSKHNETSRGETTRQRYVDSGRGFGRGSRGRGRGYRGTYGGEQEADDRASAAPRPMTSGAPDKSGEQ